MDQTAPPHPTPAELQPNEIRQIIIGVMIAVLLGALDQTIVATALPTIGRDLGNLQQLPWVVTAYLLTSTAVTPLYGKLSDVHGRRTMLMIAISVFLVGSVLCALAPSMLILVGARALQGLGGGGLMSLGQTVIADIVAPRERGRYQAYFATVFTTSSVGGPVVGGFFAEHLHWSFIFWLNLPLGAAAFAITNRALLRLPRHDRPHRIDFLGTLLMVVATVALLMALSWGGITYPWVSLQVIGLIGASLLGWVLFVLRLERAPEPFIPLDVMLHPVVRNGIGATFFAVGAMVGLSIYLPIHFEVIHGLTASQSGMALIFLMGGVVSGATVTGRLMMRLRHYKRPATLGLTLSVIAAAVLAAFPVSLPLPALLAVITGVGVGIGTLFPVTTTGVQNAVARHQLGTVTGALNFARSLGGAILVALLGAILLGSGVRGDSGGTDLLQSASADPQALAGAFRGVFIAVAASLAASWLFLLGMHELPLRGREPAGGGPAPA